MYIDVKVTVWERVQVPEELEDLVKIAFASDKLDSESDVSNLLGTATSWETLYDFVEPLSPEENGGMHTLEVWDDEQLIYKNTDQ